MAAPARRAYRSSTRQKQAADTRTRIADAAYQLLAEKRYEGMTIDAIAQRADVSPQTVYAVFRSKAGILAELLDRNAFGPGYEDLTGRARETKYPPDRLRYAARIARHIFDAQAETIDLLRGVGLVTPELAELIEERERLRFDNQRHTIEFVRASGWLHPDINAGKARDILWSLTSREMYRMLVCERKWASQQYEDWLGDVLVSSLLQRPRAAKTRMAKK